MVRHLSCDTAQFEVSGAATTELERLLHPVEIDEFFKTYWTKQFLYVSGQPDKFAHLFSWDVLNQALEQQRFAPKRLNMVKRGRGVDPSRYLFVPHGGVHSKSLMEEFAGGASIVFNQCEEVYRPLRALCVSLERLFHVEVVANLYAARGADNAFHVHWDEQDTFIVQVSGRKRWRIWPPTRRYPFKQDLIDTSDVPGPAESPCWDGLLEQGGLLSLPRGWWHVAYPVDEPSLHLTITIQNLNGIDLLQWLANEMKRSETARMPVPVMQGKEERKQWLRAVWADVEAAWSDGLLDRWLIECDKRIKNRPSLRLPSL